VSTNVDTGLRYTQELLIRRRKELGLTLRDASKLSGISVGGLSRLERGERTPTLRSLIALTATYRLRLMVGDGQVYEMQDPRKAP